MGRTDPSHSNELMNKYFVLAKDNKMWSGVPDKDDFNWSLYNLHYRGELELISKKNTLTLSKNDYHFFGNELVRINKDVLPLHPNHKLLYETILQLNPESVFELGCGNGMHLNNLQTLSQKIKLSGIDRSKDQVEFFHESYPNLKAEIKQYDATMPFGNSFPKVDVAYTQAVIMHIKTNDSHLVALANLFNVAKKQVILMENWNSHKFMKDTRYLFDKKLISWENLYVYYRVSKENPNTRLMVCSQYPLDYPVLTNYEEMRKGLESQGLLYRFKKWLKAT